MRSITEVAQLIQVCGKIEGRVKLQKIVHLLQEAGYPFKEEFGYLHHGPYSSDLKREIDQLLEWKLVEQKEEPVIDFTQYSYSPTIQLAEVLKQIGVDPAPGWSGLAKELNHKSSTDLEAISTIKFLQRRQFAGAELKKRFEELKPHLSGRFDHCLNEAQKIRAGTH